MKDYFVRAIESEWESAVASLVSVGALIVTEGVTQAATGGWDYIGPVHKGTGVFTEIEGEQVEWTEPVKDENGNLYLHANLRTTSELSSPYFIPAPANPARVFF